MPQPTFIGIGAAKAGTTSLYSYLAQHPEIFVSAIKEPMFFAIEGAKLSEQERRVLKGAVSRYSDYLRLFEKAGCYTAAGEISTIYLGSERAPNNIRARLPQVKLFAILRDPVDRMFSQYLHNVRSGHEQEIGFLQAIRRDEQSRNWDYIPQSCYFEGLRRYYDLFDPSQIEILYYDDFESNPLGVLARLFFFLGVDTNFQPETSYRRNVTYLPKLGWFQHLLRPGNPVRTVGEAILPVRPRQLLGAHLKSWNRRKPNITPEERRAAIPYIEEDVRRLARLLKTNLDHWLTV